MKGIITLFCLSTIVGVAIGQSGFFQRMDHSLIMRIMDNDRLFDSYFNCLMDRGNCDPEAETLKRLIPRALEDGCASCINSQRKSLRDVCLTMINNRPDKWEEFLGKYDPNGLRQDALEEFLHPKNIR